VRGVDVGREAEARALIRSLCQRTSPQLAQTLERVAALLTGVTVALERMGGTTLPGFREDISSLRAQMSEFQHEMAGYRAAQMDLANLAEAMKIRQALGILPAHRDEAIEALKAMADEDDSQPAIKSKRRPGRPRKSKPAGHITEIDR
jgi:hypothetical protein